MFTPPAEMIEASFASGKINDGKIKILVSNSLLIITCSMPMESTMKVISEITDAMVKALITILMVMFTKENSLMINVLVKAKYYSKMAAHSSVNSLMIKQMAMVSMKTEMETVFKVWLLMIRIILSMERLELLEMGSFLSKSHKIVTLIIK